MSSYVGNRSNSPLVDFMLDAIQDRGYDAKVLDAAVQRWNEEGTGEDGFWSTTLGPAIDNLERTLGHFGLEVKAPRVWQSIGAHLIEHRMQPSGEATICDQQPWSTSTDPSVDPNGNASENVWFADHEVPDNELIVCTICTPTEDKDAD